MDFFTDSVVNIYHKQRLVPNVEYTPSFFDGIGYNMGLSNFSIGTKSSMFYIDKIPYMLHQDWLILCHHNKIDTSHHWEP